MLPNINADLPYNIKSYGQELASNKAILSNSCVLTNITLGYCALMFAMSMQESVMMSATYHDASKDGNTDGSRNYSMFNLNQALLQYLGYIGNNIQQNMDALNYPGDLDTVIYLIQTGFNKLGVEGMLSFVRGGKPGNLDSSYGVELFIQAMATILSVFDQQTSLLYDDRRVEIDISHV